jgi:hypothetical protein
LIGTWKGKLSGDSPTVTLNITNQDGETFSGTLNRKGVIVEFIGKIDFEKRNISMKDTKITKGKNLWNLGSYDGTILETGKAMSGTGRDKQSTYSWSFTKQ